MNIYGFTMLELEEYFSKQDEKKYRAKQVFDWLYKKKIVSFSDMTNINGKLLSMLETNFSLSDMVLKEHQPSVDGTAKFLFALKDGCLIESVLMHHEYGLSLCVTSQVGCNMGCRFCASGLLHKQRDLTASEMVLQVINVENIVQERISSVVIMGIGEPFDNYEQVMKFIRIINDANGLAIGARHITVSTSGLIPEIKRYATEDLQTNLAISLHAPNDELRNQLMPINRRYPIAELLVAVKDYILTTNRRVTIEYILLKDINDSLDHAAQLAKLLRGINVYVNLIPYNTVAENGFERSAKATRMAFYDALKKRGINVTLRHEQGHDIDAACGQLRAKRLV